MIIFACRKFSASARRLLEVVKQDTPARLVKLAEGKRIKSSEEDLLVNWGISGAIESTVECKILNPRITCRKLKQLRWLKDARIPIPLFSEPPIILSPEDESTLILARKDGMFGGEGITVCETEDQVRQSVADFYVAYIPKVAEYRVHVGGGDILGVSRKKPGDPADIAWNNHNGATQNTFKNKSMNRTLGQLAIDTCKAIKYDFGAVDIIVDEWGRPYVLEVNSAPALSNPEERIRAYADYFIDEFKKIGEEGNEEESSDNRENN